MLTLNFNPFPELETERLRLRRIKEEDKNELLALRSDKKIMQYIPRPIMKTPEEAVDFIRTINEGIDKAELINWAITLKEENKVIGLIGLHRLQKEHDRAEVGYILNIAFQQKGIMKEAITAVIDHGFKQMKLHTIEAIIDPRNISSEQVLIRNGFKKEAHFKENFFWNGEFLDSVHYGMISKNN